MFISEQKDERNPPQYCEGRLSQHQLNQGAGVGSIIITPNVKLPLKQLFIHVESLIYSSCFLHLARSFFLLNYDYE